MRKLLLISATAAFLTLCSGGAGASSLPQGFVGISPQNAANAEDFELMEKAGIDSVRLPMVWSAIQEKSRAIADPDWTGFDRAVRLAAECDMEVFPFLSGAPGWVTPNPGTEPVENSWQRWAWSTFLRDAVRRYGPGGAFWEENPGLPFVPIRRWEIWNEENIVTFSERPSPVRFARLIRLSGRILHAEDPGSKVILGGLFGRPLQIPPNVASGDFLSRFYRAGRVKQYFDGVALHPYVADASAMRAQIANLRRVMRIHGDAATPFYVTELGWGSDSFESRWERGLDGQARQLDRALAILAEQRLRWRVRGVWWFSWTDEVGACQFCDSAGLLTARREAKPAWYEFNFWTGGDPHAVPRMAFED